MDHSIEQPEIMTLWSRKKPLNSEPSMHRTGFLKISYGESLKRGKSCC
jgi:hypothetical protein